MSRTKIFDIGYFILIVERKTDGDNISQLFIIIGLIR
jgi:hypothetical protein